MHVGRRSAGRRRRQREAGCSQAAGSSTVTGAPLQADQVQTQHGRGSSPGNSNRSKTCSQAAGRILPLLLEGRPGRAILPARCPGSAAAVGWLCCPVQALLFRSALVRAVPRARALGIHTGASGTARNRRPAFIQPAAKRVRAQPKPTCSTTSPAPPGVPLAAQPTWASARHQQAPHLVLHPQHLNLVHPQPAPRAAHLARRCPTPAFRATFLRGGTNARSSSSALVRSGNGRQRCGTCAARAAFYAARYPACSRWSAGKRRRSGSRVRGAAWRYQVRCLRGSMFEVPYRAGTSWEAPTQGKQLVGEEGP